MSVYGRYDPAQSGNSSSLFIYRETPVASQKMNRWNGNLAAGFDLLHAVLSSIATRGEDGIIAAEGSDALRVVPADPADMSVQVNAGWAVFNGGFAGLAETAVVPDSSSIVAPSVNPRIDLVALTPGGELELVAGDEAESPVAPTPSAGSLILAEIALRPGASRILGEDNGVDGYLIDKRPRLIHGESHRHNDDASPVESADGARDTFSTANPFRSGTLHVYLNGVRQSAGHDFDEDENNQSYTFHAAPPAGSLITHDYIIEAELQAS